MLWSVGLESLTPMLSKRSLQQVNTVRFHYFILEINTETDILIDIR